MANKILVSFALLVCLGLQDCVNTTSIHRDKQVANVNNNEEDGSSVKKEHVLAMEFIASCVGTNFYLDSDLHTQSGARSACETFGMRLATFASRAQLQCVTVALTNNIPFAWTDGTLIITPASYQSGGDFVASDITVTYYSGQMCGLLLNNDDSNPRLVATMENSMAQSICML